MGFGSFFKKLVNPLTPFKGAINAGKSLARGDVKGALLNSTVGGATMGLGPSFGRRGSRGAPGGAAPPSQEAQDFFNRQSEGDRAGIMGSFGNAPPRIQEWYDNAKAQGGVPQDFLSSVAQAVQPQQTPAGGAGGFGPMQGSLARAAMGPQSGAQAPPGAPGTIAGGAGGFDGAAPPAAETSPLMQSIARRRRMFDMQRQFGPGRPPETE